MLSLSNVGTGQAAATYYEAADDYYSKDSSPSGWWGAGAASLGLEGEVDSAAFAALLDGCLPSGEVLHHAAAGRRGGTDATFSAPKSVSLQAMVGGDRRLTEAHRLAVERALSYAEKFASCRVTEAGITRTECTGNLLVARFDHDLSRACDPQLHTHCVMINATRRGDGQWRAMDNEPIYRLKMLLGALYRAELARELQALGYKIRATHLDGRFELAHIDEHQVRAFSQRSAAIEAYLKEHQGIERGQASAWDKRLVAVITRDKKTTVDREYLLREWRGLSHAQDIDYVPAHRRDGLVPEPGSAPAILAEAIAHLSEREAVFSHTTLLGAALAHGVGRITLVEAEAAILDGVESGVLIQAGERYTTLSAQQLEGDILALENQGRGTVAPIHEADRSTLTGQLDGLSEDQRNAALGILLTRNQVTGIQGRAGAGKTTLLRTAAELATACGYTVKGLAPSASAARELAATGIMAETTAAFMHRDAKGLDRRTLLIVDEAGMASSRQTHAILTAAADAQCHVVLVGDTAQLQAVEAGKPFAQLQAAGMHTSLVSQIQRQKDAILRRAVELAVDGQVAMAVALLDKDIVQIPEAGDRFERIASDYAAMSAEERENARVIAGTRIARNEINHRIRTKLGLAGQSQAFALLERKDHTDAQRRSILSYESGDLILAATDYASLGLKRGEAATVVERLGHRILLKRDDGAQVVWQPAVTTKLTAYVPVTRQLAVGEVVRITANDRARGLINGDLARVAALDEERHMLTLAFADGRCVQLDGRRPLALDYGYCSTVYASQGQTCDRVLIDADSYSLTANQASFYVAISRAKQLAQIYTDDREMLPIAMTRDFEKTSALDLEASPSEMVPEGAAW